MNQKTSECRHWERIIIHAASADVGENGAGFEP